MNPHHFYAEPPDRRRRHRADQRQVKREREAEEGRQLERYTRDACRLFLPSDLQVRNISAATVHAQHPGYSAVGDIDVAVGLHGQPPGCVVEVKRSLPRKRTQQLMALEALCWDVWRTIPFVLVPSFVPGSCLLSPSSVIMEVSTGKTDFTTHERFIESVIYCARDRVL